MSWSFLYKFFTPSSPGPLPVFCLTMYSSFQYPSVSPCPPVLFHSTLLACNSLLFVARFVVKMCSSFCTFDRFFYSCFSYFRLYNQLSLSLFLYFLFPLYLIPPFLFLYLHFSESPIFLYLYFSESSLFYIFTHFSESLFSFTHSFPFIFPFRHFL